ncbi:hypothetical protein P5490_003325 [Bacillus altitudinis]|uniref:hypothetical protein n=1 Tax=Bacillus altitudinis TaxID=293387 RepID=UPI0037ECA1F6|nr:hypothetical protein [Bacillus altitudinis]
MNYKYKEFDMFTVDQIKSMVNHDIDKALELFADGYVAAYRIEHEIGQVYELLDKRNEELRQALDLCKQCLMLVETAIQNRK